MVLSVIIVNYQVKYFLQLCLQSLEIAVESLEAEILVVDNHSGDGSIDMLRPLFPGVRFIVNSENKGFGRANNEALTQARGKYILFLNPDTILAEDSITSCLSFLEARPDAGGMGVRMIDGSGHFLKESRRGFPTPWVAFCKMAGLTRVFPHSRLFAGYYLGHEPEDKTGPAAVLSGACLWVRKAILEEVGGFDERFFMYAEDIDLSYRIEKAGYVNYYYAGTTIIHFKGESTKKDIRYIKQFYKAMSQFRRKHFTTLTQRLVNTGIEIAIWGRASIGALFPGERLTSKGQQPITVWLTGDEQEIKRVKDLLPAHPQLRLTEDKKAAKEWWICKGPGFTFKEGIALLTTATAGVRFIAAGSKAALGSTSSDKQGDLLIL